MKRIATEARMEMETLFGGKVFLEALGQGQERLGRRASAPASTRYEGSDRPCASASTTSGYVLHTYPYSETSLIVEVFTGSTGASRVVAGRAATAFERCAGVLRSFQPLALTWFWRRRSQDPARRRDGRGGTALLAGRACSRRST